MQVRRAGLGRRREYPQPGVTRWVMLALVTASTAATSAAEEREIPTEAVKPEKTKAEARVNGASRPSAPTRIASADRAPAGGFGLKTATSEVADAATAPTRAKTPIDRALRAIADSQTRYERVEDYTCTFYKRERIAGRITPLHVMSMKVRTKPQSIYFRFQQPAHGREAIYIAGRNGSKILAHDVGFNKILAGTLALEPTSSRAMEDCRHPITEAGIGPLLETLAKRWAVELDPEETKLAFRDDTLIGPRRCTMIESAHPRRRPEFLHHMVRVYIDQELGLPIRFEAFDWPRHQRSEPELTEEYSYINLKLNVGLRDIDFDVSNSAYSFGRF
jgi:Protein of unknown function (DUF1571)